MLPQEPKLISGNANRPMAERVARRMSMHRGRKVSLVDARVERFNDGEVFVEVFENVRGENMFIMQSDNVHFWNECQKLAAPLYPWEFVQIGNCGPPIETEHGWLLLTHGVGPVRQYCIGACLLDLDDPSKVIGHLDQPLIIPHQDERDGYVPNVGYTCGALANAVHLVIPYAMSDSATTFATVKMDELMNELTNNSKSCPSPDRRVNAR